MGTIVRRNTKRIRCEVHPCREIAEFSICEEGRRQVAFNVCAGHLKQIVEEGGARLDALNKEVPEVPEDVVTGDEGSAVDELFGNNENADPAGEIEPVGTIIPETTETPSAVEPDVVTEPTEAEETDEDKAEEEVIETIIEENADLTAEVYTCKHCGVTFPKTKEGRTLLMTHSRYCPNKPPKE